MNLLLTGASGFIGTNTVQHFLDRGVAVLNLDRHPPFDAKHLPYWKKADIMDAAALAAAFHDFQPDAVIHLAARAECDENTTVETGYRMNTEGTQHVLDAIRATPSVKRAIIISSQFVCGPDHPPKHDEDFHPVTVYGQSKVITEQLTRTANLACCWTLVRPTNIWGPWHQRYTREFWKVAAKGWYVHPGGKPVMRCYGYVGNLVNHLDAILQAEPQAVHRQVFYLSDPPADIYQWANAFCIGLRGQPARRVARPILKLLGRAGDMISKLSGKPFYITSGRVNSMTSDYLVPGAVEKTIGVLGAPRHSLEEGVATTLAWLRSGAANAEFLGKRGNE
jgi:nucleoside-diphosphate-sugar epimerase